MNLMRSQLVVGILGIAAVGSAATYTFTPLPAEALGRVRIEIAEPALEFHMPAWAPGDYQIFNYGRFITEMSFYRKGSRVNATPGLDDNTWTIKGGADAVEYKIKPSGGNFSPNLVVRPNETFVSPPGVLGWFSKNQNDKHELRLALVPGGARAYTTLNKTIGPRGFATFTAPNYDELIDAPFVISDSVREHTFQVRGKQHRIIAFNRNEKADLEGFAQIGTAAAEAAFKLFGELPYPQYAFFLDFGGRGGGLEHLNSTRIGLGPNATGRQAAGIMFHEYFHAFNVKRIRSKPLGPFDYTKPAVTGALWWLEGVTDYYAALLGYRSGVLTLDEALRDFGGNMGGMGEARMRVSADEASRRVWEARGSFGFGGLSYYTKGHALGVFLDLSIRLNSAGKASLDDVIRKLYQETKGSKPGFSETRIRELCIEFGGPNLAQLYDAGVMQAGEIPWHLVLPKVGLLWDGTELAIDPEASGQGKAIRDAWLRR